jgi:hypothetical protein
VYYAASHYSAIINDKKHIAEEAELLLISDPFSQMKSNLTITRNVPEIFSLVSTQYISEKINAFGNCPSG